MASAATERERIRRSRLPRRRVRLAAAVGDSGDDPGDLPNLHELVRQLNMSLGWAERVLRDQRRPTAHRSDDSLEHGHPVGRQLIQPRSSYNAAFSSQRSPGRSHCRTASEILVISSGGDWRRGLRLPPPRQSPAAWLRRPRPVKWCTRLSASSSPDVYAAAAIAITSSGSSTGSASALAIDSALM